VNTLLLILELTGVFVFAIGGAVTAVRHGLDFFGVLVLSFVGANAGGITRDLLIGAVPPAAISDWRYTAITLPAGVFVFFWYSASYHLRVPLLILDTAGLALFSVAGTLKALDYHLHPVIAIFLGVLTGVGGGIARDVLVSEIPAVLRTDFYAFAALFGGIVVVTGLALGYPMLPVAFAGAGVCFGLRMIAIWRGWSLPVAKRPVELEGKTERKD
jgi:uncharacterized membrane protein YeiH